MEKYIAAAIAALVACYYFLAGGSSFLRERDVLNTWPLVDGKVISREIVTITANTTSGGRYSRTGSSSIPLAQLAERFQVTYQGQTFETLALDDMSYFSSSLREVMAKHTALAPVGQSMPIRLNPDQPKRATTLTTFGAFWDDSFGHHLAGFIISAAIALALVIFTF